MIFAYFIPGKSTADVATEQQLTAFGLDGRFRDLFGRLSHENIIRSDVHNGGPGGSGGVLLQPGREEGPLLWKEGGWETEPSDCGKFFVCWPKGQLPGPDGLKRRKIVDGCDVEMLDGRVWHCPTIRRALAIPNLPRSFERRKGEVRSAVLPSYRWLWEKSGDWAAQYFGSGLNDSQLVDIATTCLGLNYRVADEELRILGLLGRDGMARALEVAVDADFVKDAQTDVKKKEFLDGLFAGPSSEPGGEDSAPVIESRAAS